MGALIGGNHGRLATVEHMAMEERGSHSSPAWAGVVAGRDALERVLLPLVAPLDFEGGHRYMWLISSYMARGFGREWVEDDCASMLGVGLWGTRKMEEL